MAVSKITRVCQRCGIEFQGWTGNKGYYCSHACYHAGDRERAVARFWQRVHKTDDCWIWTGPKNKNGYGKTGIGTAHRVAWAAINGPIPEGKSILHKCDNPPCCRPDHLFLGTLADNSADMVAKGRSLKGVRHPCVVITEDMVREIRALYVPRKVGFQALGNKFGIAPSTVHAILIRKIWSHI